MIKTNDFKTPLLENGSINRDAFVKIINYDSAIKILRRFKLAKLTE